MSPLHISTECFTKEVKASAIILVPPFLGKAFISARFCLSIPDKRLIMGRTWLMVRQGFSSSSNKALSVAVHWSLHTNS